ncbi:MAG TPA: FadD3 family acyl-CoA ligase [Acidimicrobiales bacterium]|nr:FadD3 family acyl-CoA ligase [Acidimicrobiales bacterium]
MACLSLGSHWADVLILDPALATIPEELTVCQNRNMVPSGAQKLAEDRSIGAMVLSAAELYGEIEAVVDLSSESAPIRLSYIDLAEQVQRCARAAIGAGLSPGGRAAIWAPNLYEWIVAALGVLSAGGVLVPVNTRFKGSEARYLLDRSKAELLFTVRGFLGIDYPEMLKNAYGQEESSVKTTIILREFAGHEDGDSGTDSVKDGSSIEQIIGWDEFLRLGESVSSKASTDRARSVGRDDLGDIIFTSGTTGNPKGVMTTQGQTLTVFREWGKTVGVQSGDRYLVVNPFFHTFGYKAGIIASLMHGATLIPMVSLDVDALLGIVEQEKITVLPGPPTLYSTILDHPDRSKYDLSSLRLAVTGAAVVPVELIRRMRSELQFETVLTAYGLTESTGTATMCRQGDDPETIANTSGRAIPGTEVKVVNPDGIEVDPGIAGEVIVKGYNVMLGYLDDPVQSKEAIDQDGWLHTGDIGTMDKSGNLKITDRKKDMFIVGGFNAYPAEIENIMMGYPAISQVAVIGVPDERMGEVGCAFVVPRPGMVVDERECLDWCKEQMANYKVPRRVIVSGSLPLNASGKVLKGELRQMISRKS